MAFARIELTPVTEDESRRRRDQRRGIKALLILTTLIALVSASPDPEAMPRPEAAIHLTPDVTEFGAQEVGTSSSKRVTLTSAKPFVIAGIVAEGAATQSDFRVDASKCATIEPGTDCLAVVSFTPHAAGAQSAKFRIVDAANATSETFLARGTGTEPP